MNRPRSDTNSSSGPSRSAGRPKRRCGNAPDQRLSCVRGEEIAVQLGLDIAGAQRIHADVVPRPFHRQRTGQLHQPAFGRRIGGHMPGHTFAKDRRDIDNRAPLTLGGHGGGGDTGHMKGPLEIGVNDPVNVIRRVIQRRRRQRRACVVDHDVKGSVLERPLDRGRVGHIHLNGFCPPTCCGNLIAKCLHPVQAPRSGGDMHALPRQKPRKMRAKARGCPRHKGGFAGQTRPDHGMCVGCRHGRQRPPLLFGRGSHSFSSECSIYKLEWDSHPRKPPLGVWPGCR